MSGHEGHSDVVAQEAWIVSRIIMHGSQLPFDPWWAIWNLAFVQGAECPYSHICQCWTCLQPWPSCSPLCPWPTCRSIHTCVPLCWTVEFPGFGEKWGYWGCSWPRGDWGGGQASNGLGYHPVRAKYHSVASLFHRQSVLFLNSSNTNCEHLTCRNYPMGFHDLIDPKWPWPKPEKTRTLENRSGFRRVRDGVTLKWPEGDPCQSLVQTYKLDIL